MQKFYMNYANYAFKVQQKRNTEQVKNIGGIENVISYSPKDIDDKFYKENKKLLNKVRGGGYWVWKFYFIHKILTSNKMKNGDVLFYCDCGVEVLKDLNPLYELPKKYKSDIILFDSKCKDWPKCGEYTKRDAFILMDCDEDGAYDFLICFGGFHMWRKSSKSIAFIEQCLKYACQTNIIDDSTSKLGDDLPEYKVHRHDQSLISLVAYKNNIKAVDIILECIYDYGSSINNPIDKKVDFKNPKTYLIPNRAHNRNYWQRLRYKIALLRPEIIGRQGGFWGYVMYKSGLNKISLNFRKYK